MLPSSVIIIMCCRDNSKAVRRERREKKGMKETVAVASWAVLLLSDLGQSHLLLGKSHVQKNGVNGCESERGGGGGGRVVGRG